MRFLKFGLFALAALTAVVMSDAASAATTERASVSSSEVEGNAVSAAAAISDDGRFIAFHSDATTLHADDGDSTTDIFVRDLLTGTTTLVSRATGVSGAKSNGYSANPSISADGRFVAFESGATNLDAADIDTITDIFLRDLQANTTKLLSRATGGGAAGNGFSLGASISADGEWVAFYSDSTNLIGSDTDVLYDIFIRNTRTDATSLVSRATGASGAKGNADSYVPKLSDDGRYVAFFSNSNNLHADDTSTTGSIFVRDRTLSTTTLISRASGASGANANATANTELDISGNGQLVVYSSTATNLHADDTDAVQDIFTRDLSTNTTMLISRATLASGAKSNNLSRNPSLSQDGRYVVFDSAGTNLVTGDTNDVIDVFVRDLSSLYTVRADLSSAGSQTIGYEGSTGSVTNAGAIAFHSRAFNLVVSDNNSATDVFVRNADADQDRILDPYDNCADTSNASQTNSDADGSGNACDTDDDNDDLPDDQDQCPTRAEDFDAYDDSDGCPDTDNDADGICDASFAPTPPSGSACTVPTLPSPRYSPSGAVGDQCNNTPETFDGYKDLDGCPDPDNDNDGYPDDTDDCPATDYTAGPDGTADTGDEPLNTNSVPIKTKEDFDGVIDYDGCHDSPEDDYDLDSRNILIGNPPLPIFRDEREAHVLGTDPVKACAATPEINDELGLDAWPFDFNDDQIANLDDVLRYNTVGVFGAVSPSPDYNGRFDFDADGAVNLNDVLRYNSVGVFGSTCAP